MSAMRTRLIFIRHAESIHSLDGVVGGAKACRGLTDVGHEQARRLAQRLGQELASAGKTAVCSSVLRRAIETALPVAEALRVDLLQDCGLCTWHTPAYADGLATSRFQSEHALSGGNLFRPFEQDNETWAELIARSGRSILTLAHDNRGKNLVLVGHRETVESSFHVLGGQPLYRPFDIEVAAASITEWTTEDDPTAWPPARWTLRRFNDSGS